MRLPAVLAILCTIMLVGCAGGQQRSPEPTGTATESPSPTPSSPTPGAQDSAGDETPDGRAPVAGEASDDAEPGADEVLSPHINTSPDTGDREGSNLVVTDVRLGSHEGYDRVTFEVTGDGLVGWHVGYVDEARAQGSGFPIKVEGDAILEVLLSFIAYPPEVPEGVKAWGGPERIPLHDSGPVVELVRGNFHEGYQSFFVGVGGELPFQVRRFESPQRIVLDVAAR